MGPIKVRFTSRLKTILKINIQEMHWFGIFHYFVSQYEACTDSQNPSQHELEFSSDAVLKFLKEGVFI